MATKEQEENKSKDLMINLMTVIVFIGIIIAGLRFFEPQTYYSMTLVFDFSKEPGDAKFEQQRMSQINLLPISDEKKNILVHRTIFLGASSTMVALALGDPKFKEPTVKDEKGQTIDKWVYHFNDDFRPTVLQFENGVLLNAYKVSEHRLSGYPPPEADEKATVQPTSAATTTPAPATAQ